MQLQDYNVAGNQTVLLLLLVLTAEIFGAVLPVIWTVFTRFGSGCVGGLICKVPSYRLT